MSGLSIIIISTFSILVLSAAVSDLLRFQISNVIPISLSILFFISVILIGWDLQSAFYTFLPAIVVLFVCFIFFNMGFFKVESNDLNQNLKPYIEMSDTCQITKNIYKQKM